MSWSGVRWRGRNEVVNGLDGRGKKKGKARKGKQRSVKIHCCR